MTCSVYVIGPVDGLCKIGISRRPQTRLSQIRHREGPSPAILAVYERDSDAGARAVERAAHYALKPSRVWGEWFNVTPDEATSAVESAIAGYERGDYANDQRWAWGVKKMPVRTIYLIRRAAQIEGVTIAQWLEHHVSAWEASQAAPAAAPTAPEAPA